MGIRHGRPTRRRRDVEYTVLKRDKTGYSNGYDVVGPDGRQWDIKIGKEAQTEIVLSRILWALGYHQPATYYVTGWRLAGTWEDEGEPARFRLQSDHETDGEWAWLENPSTARGRCTAWSPINLLLSNWDFKTSNNRIYRTRDADGRPSDATSSRISARRSASRACSRFRSARATTSTTSRRPR